MGQGWQDISSPTTGVEPNAFDYNDSMLQQATLVRSMIHGQVLTVEFDYYIKYCCGRRI